MEQEPLQKKGKEMMNQQQWRRQKRCDPQGKFLIHASASEISAIE